MTRRKGWESYAYLHEVTPESERALVEHPLDPARTLVRVNGAGTGELDADLAALAATGYHTVMLAKTVGAADLDALTGYDAVALVETAAGVLADDLVASIGGTSSRRPDGGYRDVARHARSVVLLAAGAHGKAAVDAVHLDLTDLVGLAGEARDAVASGFSATAAVHPSQVAVIRAANRPSEAQIAWARDVMDTARGRSGVFAWNGRMVDGPVLRHAEVVLRRAGPTPGA